MKVGTIAYDCASGLGILAKAFVDNGVVDRVLVHPHRHYTSQKDWYSNGYSKQRVGEFLVGLDVLLLFETGLDWNAVRQAKAQGVKIAVMPMYEYTPKPFPVGVDLFICPSLLDLDVYKEYRSEFIPVPVSQPWKLRSKAQVFIHNAGHGGVDYRNGTPELLEAMQYVQNPLKLVVRGQPDDCKMCNLFASYSGKDPRVELVLKQVPSEELYNTGDVFVFPEKFNGLSLPLQEAYANGMLVMATKRFPMTMWLPQEPLIPPDHYETFTLAISFQRAVITPKAIAAAMDVWYNQDVSSYSLQGREWAQQHSWSALKPKYLAALESVLL